MPNLLFLSSLRLHLSLFLILSLATLLLADQKIRCLGIESQWSVVVDEEIKTCVLDNNIGIDLLKFDIDVNVPAPLIEKTQNLTKGLTMYGNQKSSYLPVRVYKVFPNLIDYNAGFCSITTIAKSNFQSLIHLVQLRLSNNLISRVEGITFEGLTALKRLYLSNIFMS